MKKQELKTFGNEFIASMKEAAKRADIQLAPVDIAVSVQGDYVIATALIAPPRNVPFEQRDKLFFLYLSFPEGHKMAKQFPYGYYVVERLENQTSPLAKIVDLHGKTVMELPLNIIKSDFPPEEYGEKAKEPVTVAQAYIEQSRETLYRIRVFGAHGVICYPTSGVWYWTWVVIVVLG